MSRLRHSIVTSLLLLSAAAQAAPDPKLIASCDACHGAKGVSATPGTPTIAGISAPFQTAALQAYKAKTRPCGPTDMCAAVAKLSDADISALAGYYAQLPFVPTKQPTDAAKVAAGKAIAAKSCEGCHSKGGSDPADDASILGGQNVAWLKASLTAHKAGQVGQQQKMMKEKLSKLSDADLDALVNYYGSLSGG
jgi:sulfide dehydrogenase cytochrome subunit